MNLVISSLFIFLKFNALVGIDWVDEIVAALDTPFGGGVEKMRGVVAVYALVYREERFLFRTRNVFFFQFKLWYLLSSAQYNKVQEMWVSGIGSVNSSVFCRLLELKSIVESLGGIEDKTH